MTIDNKSILVVFTVKFSSMIKNKMKLQNFRNEWLSVRNFQNSIQVNLFAMSSQGGHYSMKIANISHNLVLLFAFSVFEKVLKQMKKDGMFEAQNDTLSKLMNSSKEKINWLNFILIDKARKERNDIAHNQKTIERGECWKYIDSMEKELVNWQILDKVNPFPK